MNMAIAVGAAVVVVMALMISKAAIHTFLMCVIVIVSTWQGFCFDMAEMAERCGEAIPERLG